MFSDTGWKFYTIFHIHQKKKKPRKLENWKIEEWKLLGFHEFLAEFSDCKKTVLTLFYTSMHLNHGKLSRLFPFNYSLHTHFMTLMFLCIPYKIPYTPFVLLPYVSYFLYTPSPRSLPNSILTSLIYLSFTYRFYSSTTHLPSRIPGR